MRIYQRLFATPLILLLITLLPLISCTHQPTEVKTTAMQTQSVRFPVKSHSSGRYLVDTSGTPFMIHGDTMWQWMMGAMQSRQDITTYLDDRAKKGFTVIQLMSAWKAKDKSGAWITFANVNGDLPFREKTERGMWKLDTPNAAYFDNLKWIAEQCAQRGMLAQIVPLWLGAGQTQGFHDDVNDPANTDETLFAYGQFLGRTFAACPNVVWIHGGDRVPNEVERSRMLQIMSGIKSADTRHHFLHTAHWRRPAEANLARQVRGFEGLDLELVYCASVTYDGCLRSWNNQLNLKPVPAFMGESYYEIQPRFTPPGPWTPAMCRRQAYWSLLSGAGHIYGYEFPKIPESLHSPGAQQMALVKQVFANREWFKLIPDDAHRYVTAGFGKPDTDSMASHLNSNYVTVAATANGSLMMAYIPPTTEDHEPLTVDLSRFSGSVFARWYNPETGAYTDLGGIKNVGTHTFAPPTDRHADGANDWLLILETRP